MHRTIRTSVLSAVAVAGLLGLALTPVIAATPTYDTSTLAGKVASVNGTAGLQVRFSAFIEQEAGVDGAASAAAPITPVNVLSSPLDGTSVVAPNVTVNQDTSAAPQNETSLAIDPNKSSRIVASANDYVARSWFCDISGTPCSALGDGYSGTYFSNDGGATWCCTSSDPAHLGTLIPGVTHLTGGPYDAGGDPALAFDSRGRVYYAGLGFNRASAPNTVTVSKGTFDGAGNLSYGPPTFINPTTSPSIFNDKEWIAVDSHAGSRFQDRVYVTWTRFVFSAGTGAYVQSPIFFASSSDGGATFTAPTSIVGNVLYDQGSRPVVGPDGTLYVFWDGSTRKSALDHTYMVKSSDGGASWSKPVSVSTLADSIPLRDTAFRVNSFPAAAVASNGNLVTAWSAMVPNNGSTLAGTTGCAENIVGEPAVRASCHSAAIFSMSSDGGATWSPPAAAFGAMSRTAAGYPATNPGGSTLDAPAAAPVEDIFPSVAAANGKVYIGAYRGLTVSPWQTCAVAPAPPEGRINCTTPGNFIDNSRLDYVVRDLTTNVTKTVSTHPINSRYGFGGGFFGDYTEMAADAGGTFHALYTDTNNVQSVTWFYGLQFVPTPIHQQDIVIASGNF